MVQLGKKQLKLSLTDSSARSNEDVTFLSQDDQLYKELLLIQCIAQSVQPFEIMEDPAFIEYKIFLCFARGQIQCHFLYQN